MKINAITEADNALLHMERYVDEGAKDYSPLAARTEATPPYQPESKRSCFELVTVNVPKDRICVFEGDPSGWLRERYIRDDEILFAVHPETWAAAGIEHLDELRRLPRGEPIPVAPTASTRTVLAFPVPGMVPHYFIKLHYPRLISRFNRRLRRKNIHNSVAVSGDMTHVHLSKFAYLADTLGFTYGGAQDTPADQDWGFLLREPVPRPFEESRILVPCFALYAADRKHPDDPPLLVQFIERLGADPLSFVTDEIMVPIVECWARVARERGILLESHAQNTLLEIDRNLTPKRIVHRDFDVWIDFCARRRAGLDVPFLDADITPGASRGIEEHYSLVYDRFIGNEFFDYLSALLKRFYGIHEQSVRERVKEGFHRSFPDADAFFPARTMFYFSNEPQSGKQFTLVDMKRPPEWR